MRNTLLVALSLCLPVACTAPRASFPTPQAAVQALVDSAHDRELAEKLLGAGNFELLRSGDPEADRRDIALVRSLIQQKVEFVEQGDGVQIALLGKDAWPLPLPLVREGGGWCFDVEAGREEMLRRRIGRNELHAIASLQACVDAQQQYATVGRDGNAACYAQKMMSEGRHDGLYWPTEVGVPPSPIGELLAQAEMSRGEADFWRDLYEHLAQFPRKPAREQVQNRKPEGSTPSDARRLGHTEIVPHPFHGYFFRILTAQGKAAPGGARSYLDDQGNLRSGFAFVAWPAVYGETGIKTFIVNQQGIVFERDLGERAGDAVDSYNPDETWDPVRG